jgi:hypothetical protein
MRQAILMKFETITDLLQYLIRVHVHHIYSEITYFTLSNDSSSSIQCSLPVYPLVSFVLRVVPACTSQSRNCISFTITLPRHH